MRNDEMVIVDTSVWIEYLNKPDSVVSKKAKELVESDRAVISGVILAELLQRARDEEDYKEVREAFFSLLFLDDDEEIWEKTGRMSFDLRRKGKIIPLTDCLISVLAKENNCLIYSLDPHFRMIPGLKFYKD